MNEFKLTENQKKKYEEWRGSLPVLPIDHFGAAGGGYTFHFTPTGLGIIVEVTRADDPENHKLDLTEWEYF
jgi:hypothetical protein